MLQVIFIPLKLCFQPPPSSEEARDTALRRIHKVALQAIEPQKNAEEDDLRPRVTTLEKRQELLEVNLKIAACFGVTSGLIWIAYQNRDLIHQKGEDMWSQILALKERFLAWRHS